MSCWESPRSLFNVHSERRGQSQKPEEIYELIERLVPGGAIFRVQGLTPSAGLT